MKIENLSMKKFLWFITGGLLATSFLVLLCLFLTTKNLQLVLYGGLLTAVFLVWGGIFLHYISKEADPFHRQPVPDAGWHDGQRRTPRNGL